MLVAKGISFVAAGRRLVDAVDMQVAPGECVALMGPNGAGKSTLLKMLAGDLRPSAGEVSLNARPLHVWRPQQRARIRAVLPQHLDLAFPFTAFEVAMLGRTPHHVGAPSRHDRDVVAEVMALVDAADFMDRPYTRLSGGERARVQLARVFAQIWEPCLEGPRMLLLDEPTAPLDIAHQLELMRHLRTLVARDIGVLLIVHDINLAAAHADRILLLRDGRLLGEGAPQAVLTREHLRVVFDVETHVECLPHGRPQVVFEACTRRAA